MIKRLTKLDVTYAALILVIAFCSRGLFLEYHDLVDPTEARYASVAQEMLLSNDWVTPKIPMPEGVVAYMGKPPLHFWMTMVSYNFFGVDEWTARLPSLLSAFIILGIIVSFARRYFSAAEALTSALIAFSSGMFFFLSGASVTDVTLTACITLGVYFSYKFVSSETESKSSILLAAAFCALAFLCKGPIGVVLVALPLFFWSLVLKDFSWLKRIPWVLSALVFLIIVAPWFAISEIKTPGFLKYFFWNENIARYLLKDYGDKYGSGHHHIFGMSWLMLMLAFCPWTGFLFWSIFKQGRRRCSTWLKSDRHLLFCLCWALSTPIFFTFVQQLHAMYLLPAVPGLAMLTAIFFGRTLRLSEKLPGQITGRIFINVSLAAIFIAVVVGLALTFSITSALVTVGTFAAGSFLAWQAAKYKSEIGAVNAISTLLFVLYLTGIASYSPFIDQRRSAEGILVQMVNDDTSACEPNDIRHVGVLTKNSFSHYWTANAWKEELGEEVKIEYVPPANIATSDICYYLIKTTDDGRIPQELIGKYLLSKDTGTWQLYKKIVPAKVVDVQTKILKDRVHS